MRASHKRLMVLIGATTLVSPLSLMSYYGNLLPYLASYYYARRHDISTYIDPLWPSSVFRGTFTAAMLFTSPFELRFGLRPCMIAGIILLWVSVMGSYLAVQQPLALVLVFGGTHGMAVGIIYPTTLKLLLQALPDKAGLATGLLSVGPVLGALVNIGIAFAVINPHNEKPDLFVENRVYFSDPHLLERVPYYFLVMGTIMVGCTSIGAVLAFIGSANLNQEPPDTNHKSEENGHPYTQLSEQNDGKIKLNGDTSKTSLTNSDKAGSTSTFPSETDRLHDKVEAYNSVSSVKNGNHALTKDIKSQANSKPKPTKGGTKLVVYSELSPREAIKTGKLWCLWLCYICTSHTTYLQSNLYKQYGQLAISNDSLLVTVGIFGMVASVIGRPCVGISGDKFGIRKTAIFICLFSSLFMSLMVISLRRCPWLFAILVVLELVSVSPQTLIFSLLTTFEFGKTHCASNIGLVSSGNIFVLLLEPFIADGMVQSVGWDWLFLTGSITAAVSMIAIMMLEATYRKK